MWRRQNHFSPIFCLHGRYVSPASFLKIVFKFTSQLNFRYNSMTINSHNHTMHPTEKTLRIYREDNELLRVKIDQLQVKIQSLIDQKNRLQGFIKDLQKSNDQLSKLYNEIKNKSLKPLTPSVHVTKERVELFVRMENFVKNYKGPRPPCPQRPTDPRIGSYVPAPLLFQVFCELHPDLPPTFRIFCRQLNMLGISKARINDPTATKSYYRKRERNPPSNSSNLPKIISKEHSTRYAKIYVYLIPYAENQNDY